jgi:hypothetical protein
MIIKGGHTTHGYDDTIRKWPKSGSVQAAVVIETFNGIFAGHFAEDGNLITSGLQPS